MFYEKKDTNQQPIVLNLIIVFYTLMGMDHLLSNEYFSFIPSIQKLKADIKKYQDMFNRQLVAMVKDYTYLVIFGETRYTPYNARLICNDKNIWWFYLSQNHEMAYERTFYHGILHRAKNYSKESIIEFAMTCFDPTIFEWNEYYGGKNWYNIAKSLTIESIQNNPVLYLDHAFDLQHNSGVYLDKGADIFAKGVSGVADFLSYKMVGEIFELIYRYCRYYDSYTLKLCSRFFNLMRKYIRPAYEYNYKKGNHSLDEYRWGASFNKYINEINLKMSNEEQVRINNTQIYLLETYQPINFGDGDARDLIYIPPSFCDVEEESKVHGTDHLINCNQWTTQRKN